MKPTYVVSVFGASGAALDGSFTHDPMLEAAALLADAQDDGWRPLAAQVVATPFYRKDDEPIGPRHRPGPPIVITLPGALLPWDGRAYRKGVHALLRLDRIARKDLEDADARFLKIHGADDHACEICASAWTATNPHAHSYLED